ncbi:MAG: DUF4331 domain-containing protein [Comamonadaceae bacterium]|nr:DUF4331 domain-containing protein [Comamonadaceae bacterium]
MSRLFPRTCLSLALTLAVAAGGHAASHREAPLIALDPAADITDVYAFVSYGKANLERPADRKVALIMNVVPRPGAEFGSQLFATSTTSVALCHATSTIDQRRRSRRCHLSSSASRPSRRIAL